MLWRLAILVLLGLPILAMLLLAGLLLAAVDLVSLLRRPAAPRAAWRRTQDPDAAPRNGLLIIQSADPEFVLPALDRLKGMSLLQGCPFTVFCRDRSEILRHFVDHPRLDEVLAHSETENWWKHLCYLRRRRFRAAVAFFTGDTSYWKIKYFVFAVGARDTLLMDEKGNCYTLSFSLWYRLLERDLLGSGLFLSPSLKGKRPIRWLSRAYRWVRSRFVPAPAAVEATLPQAAAEAPSLSRLDRCKESLVSIAESALRNFLASGRTFCLPCHPDPELSVLVVLYNRAELTFQCLRSLAESGQESLEVVIADNASSDDTRALLGRIEGAAVLRNAENLHFLAAANSAARHARGRYLLFLNNDAQVLPGSLRAALDLIGSSPRIGAVGARLILPDGSLQEAGSIVWRDGSCLGYGRGDDPVDPPYMFRRDVDYCSGAFLLTRRDLFLELGGFDSGYSPAYYEETDLCVRLWERGLRVVYEPEAAVLHYEFASSSSPEAVRLHERNQRAFCERHREWLAGRYECKGGNLLSARSPAACGGRVLYVDDRVPHRSLGQGFPRSNTILSVLVQCGCMVTFYPTAVLDEPWPEVYADIPREVEVMNGYGPTRLESFLAARAGYYDFVLVSRPHNMEHFRRVRDAHPDWFAQSRIIYDAEALFSARDIERRRLRGESLSPRAVDDLTRTEVELAAAADTVLAVSLIERDTFASRGIAGVHVLGHALTPSPTPRAFEERSGFLFVGAILEETSPNGDAVLWFAREVLPILREKLGPVPFVVAGPNFLDPADLADSQIRLLGRVDDLTPCYDQARVFVAPTRFAAGLPHKVQEAAARGIPVAATPLLAAQLGWQDGEHLLTAGEPGDFAAQCIRLYTDRDLWHRIRDGALGRVRRECSAESFASTLKSAFGLPARTTV